MSVFVRRFSYDPGDTVLLNIESVNILDITPPGSILGVGSGTALLVGEFENGPFNQVLEITSPSQLQSTMGTLGYSYGTSVCNYPCAVKRSADSAATPEAWNGNGFLALNGKQFSRLFVCRVDTSVGSVQFTRLAWLTGAAAASSYALAPTQKLSFDLGSGQVDATFSATAATVTGSSATFGSITAGMTATLGYDAQSNFTVTFQAGDTTIANVVARINAAAGIAFASNSSGQLALSGVQQGTGGQVRIVSGSSGTLAALGLTVTSVSGTGNVANIASVQLTEVQTVVQTAITGVKIELDSSGSLRASNTATPGTGTLTVGSHTNATALGFTVGATSSAATGLAGTLPAGTVVTNSAGTHLLVTMQDVNVTATGAGPYAVKVRYAVDDGTGTGESPGTITSVNSAPDLGAFAVTNPSALTAAMTDAQVDAAYATTLAAGGPTTDINSNAKVVNLIWAARHSNAVRSALRANVLYASSKGCYGRICVVSPPLNTAPATATGIAAPGVAATRDERVVYAYVGANVFVPLIAQVGTAGGFGFTASGNIDQTSDGWMVSILSQLNPEENPGQDTPFTGAINGIETGANVQGFSMDNYIAFKAAGVAALRMDTDAGIAIFQSGVTSVDPLVFPQLHTISRRRMDDYIGDSVATYAKGYGKRLMTRARRKAFKGAVTSFLKGLLSPNNPESQRINGYTVDDSSVNSDTSLANGLYRVLVAVQTIPSMDSIAIIEQVSTTVSVAVSLKTP